MKMLFWTFILVISTYSGNALAFCNWSLSQIAKYTPHRPIAPRAEKAYLEWKDMYDTYQANKQHDGDVNFKLNQEKAVPLMEQIIANTREARFKLASKNPQAYYLKYAEDVGRSMIDRGITYFDLINYTIQLSIVLSGERLRVDPKREIDDPVSNYRQTYQTVREGVTRGFFFRIVIGDQDVGDFVAAHHLPMVTAELHFKPLKNADGGPRKPRGYLVHDLSHAELIFHGLWVHVFDNEIRDVEADIASIHNRFRPFYRRLDRLGPVENKTEAIVVWYTSHEKPHESHLGLTKGFSELESYLTGMTKTMVNDLLTQDLTSEYSQNFLGLPVNLQSQAEVSQAYSHMISPQKYQGLYTEQEIYNALHSLETYYPGLHP